MLFTSQHTDIQYLQGALQDRSWKEAYHLLANIGFTYEGNNAESETEKKFNTKRDDMFQALTRSIRGEKNARKNLLGWSGKEGRGNSGGGLGKACCSPKLQKVVHDFLLQC